MASAGSVHLLGGQINLAMVWEAAREELKEILGQPELKKVPRSEQLMSSRIVTVLLALIR